MPRSWVATSACTIHLLTSTDQLCSQLARVHLQVTRPGKHAIPRQAAVDLCHATAAQRPAALQQLVTAMGPEPPEISNGQPFLFFVVPRAQFESTYTTLQSYTAQVREMPHASDDGRRLLAPCTSLDPLVSVLQGRKADFQSALVNQCVLCVDLETMAIESGALGSAAAEMGNLSSAITGKASELSQNLLQRPPCLLSCCSLFQKSVSFRSAASRNGVWGGLHTVMNDLVNRSVCSSYATVLLRLYTCQRAITLDFCKVEFCTCWSWDGC